MALVERQLVSVDWDVRTLWVVHFAVRSKGGVRIKKVIVNLFVLKTQHQQIHHSPVQSKLTHHQKKNKLKATNQVKGSVFAS